MVDVPKGPRVPPSKLDENLRALEHEKELAYRRLALLRALSFRRLYVLQAF